MSNPKLILDKPNEKWFEYRTNLGVRWIFNNSTGRRFVSRDIGSAEEQIASLDETKHSMTYPHPALYLLVSTACNMQCSYCHVMSNHALKKTNMSWDVAKEAIDKWFKYSHLTDHTTVFFFGGEPLLNYPVVELATQYIVEHFSDHKVDVWLNTNATLINDIVAKFLARSPINIIVSCDGQPFVHDRCRTMKSGGGSARFVESGIEKLIEHGNAVNISMVVGGHTIGHIWNNLVYLNERFGITSFGLNMYHRGSDGNSPISVKSESQLVDEIIEAYKSASAKGWNIYQIDKRVDIFKKQGFLGKFCGANFNKKIVLPTGDRATCEALLIDLSSFKRIEESSTIYNKKCEWCFTRSICGGGCPYDSYITRNLWSIIERKNCLLIQRLFIHLLEREKIQNAGCASS